MPYAKWSDVNPALRGIKPRITLDQANKIAATADAIPPKEGTNPWAIAIAAFKRQHTVRNGAWVKRSTVKEAATHKNTIRSMLNTISKLLEDKTLSPRIRKALEGVHDAFKDGTWDDLAAAAAPEENTMDMLGEVTKTVAGKQYPASDFLVVDDAEKVDTWHLQVKRNGTPDHRLMGAAWAALNSPNGFRGNKYEGPSKGAAITKLKALYKAEDMEVPASEAAVTEQYDAATDTFIPYNVHSFASLEQQEQAHEAVCEIQELTTQFGVLVANIMYDPTVEDKLTAFNALADEWLQRVTEALGASAMETEAAVQEEQSTTPAAAAAAIEEPSADQDTFPFAESIDGAYMQMVEADQPATDAVRAPVQLDIALIQPGWGNARDNNFYPAEVLKRDAHVFEGLKMHTVDHKEAERSERTEVSVIDKIVGFTSAGAPIARVTVFDPAFAEKVRNRSAAGKLNTLECSILASGIARKGTAPDGKAGNIVESIVEGRYVDWVTRAGAGGKALRITEGNAAENADNTESATLTEGDAATQTDTASIPASTEAITTDAQPAVQAQGTDTKKDDEEQPAAAAQQVEVPVAQQVEVPAAALQDAAPLAPVVPAPAAEAAPLEQAAETCLSETEVSAALDAMPGLPAAARKHLLARTYKTAPELKEALAAEIEYIKELGAGKPFGDGALQKPRPSAATLQEMNERMDKVNEKYLGM